MPDRPAAPDPRPPVEGEADPPAPLVDVGARSYTRIRRSNTRSNARGAAGATMGGAA
ncbi:hypothetical protein ACFSM7_01580 [Clavibacter michiganensis subsp. tessellarius]|uniref:hypothetical protein n=1 Tax=Clavibacter tessellarius TaxID=31965 RepID=UPI0036294071